MINILHISPNFNYSCGVSNYVYKYIKHFSYRKDYEIHFITNGGDALSKLNDLKNLTLKIQKFTTGPFKIFYLYSLYKFLLKYCIQNNVDIIHSHHRFPEFVSSLVAKKLNIKTVTSALSYVRKYKRLSFKSDKIISCSYSVTALLINYFKVDTNKVITLYHCVDKFNPIDSINIKKLRKELNLDNEIKVILYVGRINKVKGYDILIDSYLKNFSNHDNYKLILIGGIEEKNFFKKISNINQRITYLSPSSHYYYYYYIADVVVLPSRKDPFPLVMIETGMMNKPFIGSRTGGIAEFIEDGVNGFLFELGNADDLAEKIKFVIDNPEKAKSAAEELHKKVKKYCNCEEYFAKLTSIYEDLVNSR